MFGLIFLGFGAWMFFDPEGSLSYKDRYRIKGKAEYTNFAIQSTRVVGIISAVLGIVFMVFADFN
jgi:hypothetical protein